MFESCGDGKRSVQAILQNVICHSLLGYLVKKNGFVDISNIEFVRLNRTLNAVTANQICSLY